MTRSLRRGIVAAVGVLALAGTRQGTRLASGLARGTELVYESSDRSQAPWRVDSLRTGLRLRKGADCIDVQLRRAGREARTGSGSVWPRIRCTAGLRSAANGRSAAPSAGG